MKTHNALLPVFSLVCIWTALAQAGHSSLANSHARRSLERSHHQHQKRYGHPSRLQDEKRDTTVVDDIIVVVDGVPKDVKVLRDDAGDVIYVDAATSSTISVSLASTTTASTLTTTTASATTTTDSSSTTTTDSSSSTSTTDSSSSSTTTDSASSTTTTDSSSSTTTTTDSSSSTTTTDSSSSTTTTDSSSTTTTDSASSTITDAPTSTSGSASSTITNPPASSTASCALTDLGCVVSSLTSDAGSVVSQVTSAVLGSDSVTTSDVVQTQTSDVAQSTDIASTGSATSTTPTPTPTDTPTSTSDAPASTSDVVSDILSTLTSILQTTTTPTQTPTDSSTPTQTAQSDSSTPTRSDTQVSNTVTQTYSDSYTQTQTVTASDSPTDSATASVTHTQSVSFPTFTSSPTDSEATATATNSIASDSVTDTQATLTLTTQPIPSEYSYITEASLELTSLPATSTVALTLTDPDAAFTTASLTQSGTAAPTQAVVIPTGLPTRIFPATRLDPDDPALEGMTLVSLKFLSSLTWPFVSNNTNTAALLFVYTPQTVQNAMGLNADQVLTYAMQAYAPADYSGDVTQLSTVYLLYLPADQVTVLQQQLLTPNSPLYTNQAGIPKQISQQLDASFPVNAVGLDTTVVGTGNTASGNNADAADASSASRRDAIIGVCAAFGVILFGVVLWWGYKSWKRRQDKAHRRLTHDSAGMHQAGGYGATTQTAYAYGGVYGAAPQRSGYAQPHTPLYTTNNGQPVEHFDDSSFEDDYETRRRSFFFAEDSLRGYHVPREEEQGITYTQLMRQQQGLAPNDKRRAPIQASAISAPILRESSLNW